MRENHVGNTVFCENREIYGVWLAEYNVMHICISAGRHYIVLKRVGELSSILQKWFIWLSKKKVLLSFTSRLIHKFQVRVGVLASKLDFGSHNRVQFVVIVLPSYLRSPQRRDNRNTWTVSNNHISFLQNLLPGSKGLVFIPAPSFEEVEAIEW